MYLVLRLLPRPSYSLDKIGFGKLFPAREVPSGYLRVDLYARVLRDEVGCTSRGREQKRVKQSTVKNSKRTERDLDEKREKKRKGTYPEDHIASRSGSHCPLSRHFSYITQQTHQHSRNVTLHHDSSVRKKKKEEEEESQLRTNKRYKNQSANRYPT